MARKTDNVIKFTKPWADSLRSDRRMDWYDTEVDGLSIRVSPSGRKVFCWVGRAHGSMSRIKIGKYPDFSISAARDEAKRIIGDIASGEAPQSRTGRIRDEWTIGQLYEWYMEFHSRPHKRTWKTDERRYKSRLSQWRNRKVSALLPTEVKSHHVRIKDDDGPYAANKMLELLGHMYRIGKQHKTILADDPTHGLVRFPKHERERFLSPDEMPRFLAAVNALPRETTRDFILLCLFTGARRGNVCAMRWDQLDLSSKIWTIPSEESKSGKPMSIVLPEAAMEILRRRNSADSKWVLAGGGKTGHLVEPKHAMQAALKSAGIKDVRIHDLRRTLGSWQAAQGESLLLIGKSLGHTSMRSTEVYARLNLDPIREAVQNATQAMLSIPMKPGSTKKK